MTKKEKTKSEELPVPFIKAWKEWTDALVKRMLHGFENAQEFLEWKHELVHSCLGHQESTQKVVDILPRFSWPMFVGSESYQREHRLDMYNYLINDVFGPVEAIIFHRAREDPQNKKGIIKEESDLFDGGLS